MSKKTAKEKSCGPCKTPHTKQKGIVPMTLDLDRNTGAASLRGTQIWNLSMLLHFIDPLGCFAFYRSACFNPKIDEIAPEKNIYS
jgi:hypothetical protein